MRVVHISILPATAGNGVMLGSSVVRRGITFSPIARWYAELELRDVGQEEFDRLRRYAERSIAICFSNRQEAQRDYKAGMVSLQVNTPSLIDPYVQRGVLTNPDMAVDLAKELEGLIVKKINVEEY